MTTPQPPLPPLPFDGENPWGTKFRIWSTALREWIHGKADRDHTHMIDGIPGLSSVLNNKANRDDMMAGMGIIEAADTELKDLKSNVLPELRHEVDINNLVLEDLNVNVIPAVQQELDQAKQTLSDATLWIDETGRQLDTNLEEARGKLSELEDTVLPNLEGRLGVSETNAAQAKAAADAAVKNTVVEYAKSTSRSTPPSTGWSTSTPTLSDNEYAWMRSVITYGNDSTSTTSAVLVTGNTGAKGEPGRGIESSTVEYALSASSVSAPSSGWSSTVPTVPAGQFLWTRTTFEYTAGSPTTAYSVARQGANGSSGQTSYLHTAYANSADGATGFSTTDPSGRAYLGTYTSFTPEDSTLPASYTWVLIKGATGDAGKGISSSVVSYQSASSGTTTPTGTWVASVPSVPKGHYLWTRTVLSFTDGASTTTYSVGGMGQDGASGSDGRGIVGTVVTYLVGSSGTTPPSGTWTSSVPTAPQGQFLWTRSVTSYTTGSPTTAYSVSRAGEDGNDGQTSYLHTAYATNSTGTQGFSTSDPSGKTYIGTYTDFIESDSTDPSKYTWVLIKGADGKGISSSAVHYQASASGTTTPTGTWLTTVPSVSQGQFLWTRTTINFTDGASQITYSTSRQGSDGQKGDTGAQGVSITSVTAFFRLVNTGSSAPTQPSGTGNPSGWTTTEPNYQAQRELYRTERVLYSNGTATWSPVTKVASYTGLATLSDVIDANKQVVDTLKDTTLPALEDQLGRRITAVSQRGMNYITNGFGELGDTTNFALGPWIYHSDDSPIGALGSFSGGSAYQFAPLDESIPVDASVPLLASLAVKQVNIGVTSRIYFAISPLDAYGKSIQPQNYMEQSGTRTTLARALNPGDTEIHLVSSSGWANSVGAATHRRSLIAWNYIDQGGRSWAPGTYSRNTWLNIWDDGAISGNVITLRNPWAGPAIPVDTVVGNGSAGGTYMYASGISSALVPSDGEWHTLSATMPYVGIHTDLATSASSMWPAATAKALVRIGLNAGVSGGTSLQRISAISLSPVAAANTQIDHIGVVAQLADKRLTISEAAPSATTGYPLGAHWTRVDAQNREIGYWRLTATGWVAMTMDPVVIPNLSAGKITSGTIDTARLNAQQIATAVATIIELNADRITSGKINTARLNAEEIAAVTAQFINLDVSQLTASGASIGTAVVEKLWTEVVRAKKITADMVLIGAGENYVSNPDFTEDGEGWDIPGGDNVVAFPTTTRGKAARLGPGSGTNRIDSNTFSVEPGKSYRIRTNYIMTGASGETAYMRLRYIMVDGSIIWGTKVLLPNSGWVYTEGSDTAPALARQASLCIIVEPTNNGTLHVTDVSVVGRTNASLIVDGAIQSDHLTSNSVTASKIAAGQVQTNHMVVNTINGDRIILNTLDGDKIKANSIKSEKILANSIAADRIVANEAFYARFLQAENLRAGTGVFNAAFADAVWTNVVRSRKITTDMMTVGNGDNLLPDPDIQVADAWGHSNAWISTTGAYLRGGSITVPASTTQNGNYSASNSMYNIPVVGDDSYRVVGWVKPASDVTAAGRVSLYLQARNASHVVIDTQLVASNTVAVAANTWTKLSGVGKVPTNTAYVAIGTYVQAAHNGAVTFSDLSVTKATSSSLIVDGAVTASKLNVVSEDASGGKLSIQPDGMRGWAPGKTGEPTFALLSSKSDTFELMNADDEKVAGIDISGGVSGSNVSASETVTVAGEDVVDLIGRSHKLLAFGYGTWPESKASVGRTNVATVCRVSFTVPAFHMARAVFQAPPMMGPGSTDIRPYLASVDAYTSAGVENGYPSPSLLLNDFDTRGYATLPMSTTVSTSLSSSRILGPDPVDKKYTIVYTIRPSSAGTGNATIGVTGNYGYTVAVEDLGFFGSDYTTGLGFTPLEIVGANPGWNGGTNAGGGTSRQEYTKKYTATGVKSYKGSGAAYSWVKNGVDLATNNAFQGVSLAANGALRSVWIFPTVTGDLSGATVKSARLRVTNVHTFANAGGTMKFFGHGYQSAPATLASPPQGVTFEKYFGKGTTQTISLPSSHLAILKSGALRGYGLYATDSAGYGYCAKAAVLEITYEK